MSNEETKTLEIVGAVYFKPDRPHEAYGFIDIEADKPFWKDNKDYILIAPYTIEIEMPATFDPNKEALSYLQNQRKLILAENQRKINEVDRQIQELQAIEHKP
jgi:hypothetical protein